jgi:pimeloyl-ACP methyl ester carboxylesterase
MTLQQTELPPKAVKPPVTPSAGFAIAFAGHAGWLHTPDTDRTREVGVVLCSPLGRDARCAHLPLRLLAEDLASAGIATLRYDHLGTGDSLDLEAPEADALAVWLDGVRAAVAALRERTGAKRVVLAGVRFGATLAALSAELADGLVLLGPVVRGGPWLRELKLATAVLAPTTVGTGCSGLDADGLVLSGATAAAITGIDLRSFECQGRPLLLAAQNPATTKLGEALALADGSVTLVPFDGFAALFDDSHSNLAPRALFEQVIAWLGEHFPERDPARSLPLVESAVLHPPGGIERPVTFGAGLRGVLCLPGDGAATGRAVVLCNTGGDPRAGIGGFSTATARALAREGVMSLRFDFAGLGDSPAADGAVRSHVYETSRKSDFGAAIALLQGLGAQKIVVGGVCAGGYHALHAALDDPRIAGVFAINTVILAWRAGTSLAVGDRDEGRSTQAYMQRLGQISTWTRLLKGGIDVPAILRTLRLRLQARVAARSEATPEAEVKARIGQLSARGGLVRLIVGAEDPSLDMVVSHFGPGGRRFVQLPGLSLQIVPGLDHGLALQASRDKAGREVVAFLNGL